MKLLVLIGLVAVAQAARNNCLTKCAAIFKVAKNSTTAVACSLGCQYCKCEPRLVFKDVLLTANDEHINKDCLSVSGYKSNSDKCFLFCKNYKWSAVGMCKAVVEPDKACMFGCINALCQGSVCTGCDPRKKDCCWDSEKPAGKTNGCQSDTTTYPVSQRCNKDKEKICCPDCGLFQQCGCGKFAQENPRLCGRQWAQKSEHHSCDAED